MGLVPSSQWLKNISRKDVSHKLENYSLYKKDFNIEKYLITNDLKLRRDLTKLRLSCHKLFIETGRYCKPPILRENRICENCALNKVEDEKHMVLECTLYSEARNDFKTKLQKLNVQLENSEKSFINIMSYNSGDPKFSKLLCTFISRCFKIRNTVSKTI